MSNIQAAVVSAVAQIVSLIVSFGVINSTVAGSIVSASTAVIGAAFVVAAAIENHGKAPAPAPAAK